jgi:hypothetical protein
MNTRASMLVLHESVSWRDVERMHSLLVATALLVAACAHGASGPVSAPYAADRRTGCALFAQGVTPLVAHDYAGAPSVNVEFRSLAASVGGA